MRIRAPSLHDAAPIWLRCLFLCCAGLSILLCAAGCRANRADSGAIRLRAMTYNIHHGAGTDGRVDLARIAEVIRTADADIVALQEVDKGVQRTERRDLPAELAALTGMTCVFSNNFRFQGGEYGNAVLTRLPVLRGHNTHFKMLRSGEQRGLLQLVLEIQGRQLVVMNTHIDFRPDDTERLANVEEIKATANHYAGLPAIICGDFNDTPGSRTHTGMEGQFVDCWKAVGAGDGFTYSSERPNKRIDYIFVSKGSTLMPLKAWIPDSDASDHLPLVVELLLR